MASRGRPKPQLVLTADDRATLERWARGRSTAQALALRSRIVLASEAGATNQQVAAELGVNPTTVGKWRSRFVARGLDGLSDDPRPGAPRKITDDRVEQVLVKSLEEGPPDGSRWSTRSMAAATGLSQTAVSRIWRSFGLQPQQAESFRLLTEPAFIDGVRSIAGLYLDVPERALALCCATETSEVVSASRWVVPVLPRGPSQRTRPSGTPASSLAAAIEVASTKVVGSAGRRQRATEFKTFLELLDAETDDARNVHLILDQYVTHKVQLVQRWLGRHPRFHLHFVPTGFAWLNLVERWFAELAARDHQRSSASFMPVVEGQIDDWIASWNDDPRPYGWVKTT
jgi:transposase